MGIDAFVLEPAKSLQFNRETEPLPSSPIGSNDGRSGSRERTGLTLAL